jgi:hypothetical protein
LFLHQEQQAMVRSSINKFTARKLPTNCGKIVHTKEKSLLVPFEARNNCGKIVHTQEKILLAPFEARSNCGKIVHRSN